VAVEVGFEPTEGLPPHTLSRSAAGWGCGSLKLIDGFAANCRKVLHPAEVERFP